MIRRVIATLMLLLAGTVATAQVPFPQTLPANTVYGRLGISAGPGQAIPFNTLLSNVSQADQGRTIRVRLSTNRTYYVRPAGNDACTGLTDVDGSSGSCAFKTVQFAVNTVCNNLDLNGFRVFIQLQAASTFTEQVKLCDYVGYVEATQNNPTIKGDPAAASSYTIDGTNGFTVLSVAVSRPWIISGVTLAAATGTPVQAEMGSVIYLDNTRFTTTTGVHIKSLYGSKIEAIANYTIAGNASQHVQAVALGQFLMQPGKTVTLTGTPVFSQFVACADTGLITLTGTTYSGAATGTKWVGNDTCNIDFGGKTPTQLNTLPGSLDGTYSAIGAFRGGTGVSAYVQGDTLYADASGGPAALARLAKDTNASRYLSNQGASNNPAWSLINLGNGVNGTLNAGNGGTGATTFTTDGIVFGNGASPLNANRCLMDVAQSITCVSSTAFSPAPVIRNTTNDANPALFFWDKNRAGGNTSSGDTLGRFIARGFANTAQQNTAELRFAQSAASSGSNIPSTVTLFTSNTAGLLNQSLTFNEKGQMAVTASTAPTLTAGCNGAGSSVTGNPGASNMHGTATGQTAAATTCTLTFANSGFTGNPPDCVVIGYTAPLTGAVTVSTTTMVINFASVANFKFSWQCRGL